MSEMKKKQDQVEATLRLGPVVAVVVIDKLGDAVPLARALVGGGVRAIEVTLRTPVALEAIRAIAADVEGAVVGAGTLLTPKDLRVAEEAGARCRRLDAALPAGCGDSDRGDAPLRARLRVAEIFPGDTRWRP
jgi:2-dehydro-3-deoxyphosphogluconate aldolase/(4S)-4-hydroxy-2-oxoglutarate aldolase